MGDVNTPVAPSAEGIRAEGISVEELALAARNSGMPLEALRYPITPIGLHYLLIHYDIPHLEATTYRLLVGGLVRRPLTLSLSALRARPSSTVAVTFECAGNGRAHLSPRPISQPWLHEAVGTAEWTGVSLGALLEEAGVSPGAVEVVFGGCDRGVEGGVEQFYERSLSLADAFRGEVLLAYAMNGQPLPPQHGFPLRLVVPGWYGMTSVKWLRSIRLTATPFEGYQQTQGYRLRQRENEVGEPVSRIEPRSLLIPPGIPDFLSRRRLLDAGPCQIEGRAWSGFGPVEEVLVSTDGGRQWHPARLGDSPSPFAWCSWSYRWEPPGPGSYELSCRARDRTGREQPLLPSWNLGGYLNNSPQCVPVEVRPTS